ncbi:hypothetical protein OS128_06645 [Corynebacterium sp. P5848]|uniref:hypothetical protein n=1 Tax=Corynebacterium marambiense TaxID=2765364 RepID=UPI002260AC39|nr:hypothetical protein [Corynebacterium marambiense]MCX7542590.1 hypothetical protein [Corynebacterium marambiense]
MSIDQVKNNDVVDIRIATLPAGVLKELRFTNTQAALQNWVLVMGDLDNCIEIADKALYSAIGVLDGMEGEEAKQLLRIKRALRRGRTPRQEMLVGLSNALSNTLHQVILAHARCEEAIVNVERAFAADRTRTKNVLARVATEPLLRNGILCSAPTLEALIGSPKWPDYLNKDKRATRVAQFIYRAAAKTSPFSTFTCTGRPHVGACDTAIQLPYPESVRIVRQLDGRIWALLMQNLRERDQIKAVLRLRPNPSLTWITSLSRAALLGPPPMEQLRLLPIHPAFRTVLAAPMEAAPPSIWKKRLAEDLYLQGESDEASMLVEKLLRAGILQPDDPVSESSDRPVSELVQWLRDRGVSSTIEWFPSLARLASLLEPSPSATDGEALRSTRNEAGRSIEEILGVLNYKSTDLGGDVEPIHESAVVDRPVVTPAMPATDDLITIGAAHSWLSVLDTKWPGRLTVAAFGDTFLPDQGTVPLLEFYRAVNKEMREGESRHASLLRTWFSAVPLQPESGLPTKELTPALHQLRSERQRNLNLVTRFLDEEHGVSRIPLNLVQKQLHERAKLLCSTAPSAVYIQETGSTDARWVINVFHGGHGRGRSRTNHLMSSAGLFAQPIVPKKTSSAGRVVVAEWTGTHGSSLNARQPVLSAAIDYPYTTGPSSGQYRIPISCLHVRRSDTRGLLELIDIRDGTVINPAHTGMLADYQLPPLARFVERVFGDAYLMHPSNPPFASNLALNQLTEITRVPQVQVEDVVIQRRRFIVPIRLFPRPESGQSDEAYLRVLYQWFSNHALPTTCYARAWGRNLSTDKVKSRKPMIFDLYSWWTVTELLRHSGGADFVVLDDALPDPFRKEPASPVTEILIETPAYFVGDREA